MAEDKVNILEYIITEQFIVESAFLGRDVIVDAYLPASVNQPEEMSLLLINDGQDLPKMPFDSILDDLIGRKKITPVLCIGIHCGPDRKMEYGTANQPDFKGRGAKAGAYTQFVFEELLPLVREKYNVPVLKEKGFAGFSLGGLSALDIVWNNPQEFTRAAVFSGSLWWRSKDYADGYHDFADRIMHAQVRNGQHHSWLSFFFECGTEDEKADRNNNGIIDSIDDTLDLIQELKALGYNNQSIKYLQLEGGRHDVDTWALAFPAFLQWAYPQL